MTDWAREQAARRLAAAAEYLAAGRTRRAADLEFANNVIGLRLARIYAGSSTAGADADEICPFKGLASFDEEVRPGAFSETLATNPDVSLMVNHEGLPLARTGAPATLTLTEDTDGLRFVARCDRSDPDVRSVVGKIKRGLMALEADPPSLDPLPNVGQIALACFLGHRDLRFAGDWRAAHPKLVTWLDRFAAKVPAFAETKVAA